MNILSLSSVFPNPNEPGLGLFVRARLAALSRLASVRVIAPIPILDYSNPRGHLYRKRTVPMICQDGAMEVLHPRWVYPPGGTPMNVACLVVRLYSLARRLHKQRAFDLIDTHFGYPEGVAATVLARAFQVPLAITLRGSELAFAAYPMRRIAMRWAFRRASRVVAVSEELGRFAIAEGAPAEQVAVIPNGVDQDTFYPRDRDLARRKYGIPDGCKLIVSAGELIEAKGHQHVAEALAEVVNDGADARLLIVGGVARGGPKYEVTLREFVERLGLGDRIRLMGWVGREDMAEMLSAADVFCLASYTEGWPNVVHEAMACGTPVIATRVGAVPEMLPSADYGLIVPVKDQPALSAALRAAIGRDWDRERIAQRGRERTWDHVSQQVFSLFREMVRGKSLPIEGEHNPLEAGDR